MDLFPKNNKTNERKKKGTDAPQSYLELKVMEFLISEAVDYRRSNLWIDAFMYFFRDDLEPYYRLILE